MDTEKDALKLFVTSMVMIILVEMVMGRLAKLFNLSNTLVLVGCARVLEILLMVAAAYYFTKGYSIIGLDRDRLAAGLKTGVLWSLGFGALVLVVSVYLYYRGLNPLSMVASKLPEDKVMLILFFVVGGVVGPLGEEIFFRGICYGYFRKWGILSAIIVTTGIFVVAHAAKNTIPAPQIVGGIVFALSYEVSKSLISPIVIHIAGNLAIFSISLLA